MRVNICGHVFPSQNNKTSRYASVISRAPLSWRVRHKCAQYRTAAGHLIVEPKKARHAFRAENPALNSFAEPASSNECKSSTPATVSSGHLPRSSTEHRATKRSSGVHSGNALCAPDGVKYASLPLAARRETFARALPCSWHQNTEPCAAADRPLAQDSSKHLHSAHLSKPGRVKFNQSGASVAQEPFARYKRICADLHNFDPQLPRHAQVGALQPPPCD